MKIVDFEKVRKYSKKDFIKTLDQYKAFLTFLGSPQLTLKTIILTGSTGKGTTAQIISEILCAHQYKVGLYTSPHIVKPNERIKINKKNISDKELEKYKQMVQKRLNVFNQMNKINYEPTFFELFTLIAFLYFQKKKVDFSVLEVGIGGHLDATNVTDPLLNFILPVCKEHTDFLGHSLKKILQEKQQVIKKNSHTITLITDKSLLKMLKKHCDKQCSMLYKVNDHFSSSIENVILKGIEFLYIDIHRAETFFIPLTSINIVMNFSAVIFGLQKIIQLDWIKVKKALKQIIFQARFSRISIKKHDYILDGGHNILAVDSLIKTIRSLKLDSFDLIFTIMCDKKIVQIFKMLSKITDTIILTHINSPRECSLSELEKKASRYFRKVYCKSNLKKAIQFASNKYVVLFGSFYLIGEFFKVLPKIKVYEKD